MVLFVMFDYIKKVKVNYIRDLALLEYGYLIIPNKVQSLMSNSIEASLENYSIIIKLFVL